MEAHVHLDITVWWGAAGPSLALQEVIVHLGVWHSVWSAQKAFTAQLLPQTTQIALQVGLIAPTHSFWEVLGFLQGVSRYPYSYLEQINHRTRLHEA